MGTSTSSAPHPQQSLVDGCFLSQKETKLKNLQQKPPGRRRYSGKGATLLPEVRSVGIETQPHVICSSCNLIHFVCATEESITSDHRRRISDSQDKCNSLKHRFTQEEHMILVVKHWVFQMSQSTWLWKRPLDNHVCTSVKYKLCTDLRTVGYSSAVYRYKVKKATSANVLPKAPRAVRYSPIPAK